jgi:hypothetical protein
MTRPPDLPDEPLPELSRLPRELAPPPGLEARVVTTLRDQSLLRRNRLPWIQVAAAVLLLAGGIGIGRLLAPAPVAPSARVEPRFMLLLWGAAETSDDNARAGEYAAWAGAERRRGRQISGERLAEDALLVERDGTAQPVPSEVQGFFIVSATSIDEAVVIARSSPHVRDGGRIVVRPINTP